MPKKRSGRSLKWKLMTNNDYRSNFIKTKRTGTNFRSQILNYEGNKNKSNKREKKEQT